MPQQHLIIGAPNSGQGDPLFTLATKVEANFNEVYSLANAAITSSNGKQPLNANLTALSTGTITGVGTTAGTLAAGNDSRIVGAVQQSGLSSALDTAFSSTRGSVLYRGASGWLALAPGTSGYVLATGGTGGDPSWVAQATGGSGVSSAALDSAFGSTQGSILYRSASAWTTLTPGAAGYLLQTGGAGANPSWTAPPSTNTSVPTRQTAISGPAASSAPSFLPATSGSLTLTAQNISSTVPLIVSAAQGGVTNATYAFTSNPSWTVSASATSYLFVNATTGATVSYTLAPIYQFGGTISTTNGQFTFDTQAMVGYLGNGSTAVVTPLVCVGEAVASASAVTSTVAYAYQGRYQAPTPVSIAQNAAATFNHNIGVPTDQLALDAKISTGTNGPWVPALAYYTSGPLTVPAVGTLSAGERKAAVVISGTGGFWTSNGSNYGASSGATAVFATLTARRNW